MSYGKIYNPRYTSVKSIILAAIERIEQGWTRGIEQRTINGQEHFCAYGAIRSVARDLKAHNRAVDAVYLRLNISDISQWNDQPGMRKRDVVKGLKSIIPFV